MHVLIPYTVDERIQHWTHNGIKNGRDFLFIYRCTRRLKIHEGYSSEEKRNICSRNHDWDSWLLRTWRNEDSRFPASNLVPSPPKSQTQEQQKRFVSSELYTFTVHPWHVHWPFCESIDSVRSLALFSWTKVSVELDAWISFPETNYERDPVSLWCSLSLLFCDYHWALSRR